jgi:hypothetical protein
VGELVGPARRHEQDALWSTVRRPPGAVTALRRVVLRRAVQPPVTVVLPAAAARPRAG